MRSLLALPLILSACGTSALDRAEERYAFLQRNGATVAELCRESRRILSLAADAGDQERYDRWRVTSAADCAEAHVSRLRS
jgi:hypothetical protein